MMSFEILTKVRSELDPSKSLGKVTGEGREMEGEGVGGEGWGGAGNK